MIKVKPVCPKCQSDNVLADACARWDPDHDGPECGWVVSGVYDNLTCGACGYESKSAFIWLDFED